MMKIRQDAWSEEDDLLLAETVLRHVREGSTQLHAFEEVGDKLERTSAAVGFRWNAIVRKKYEQALKIAKKQRKERQRALAKGQQNKPKTIVKPAKPADDEVYHPEEFFKTPYTAPAAQSALQAPSSVLQTPTSALPEASNSLYEPVSSIQESSNQAVAHEVQPTYQSQGPSLTLEEVIHYLSDLNRNGLANGRMQDENTALKRQNEDFFQQNRKLTEQLSTLEKEFAAMKEDYQALLQIMDRARRMVLLQDDAGDNQSFRMDKNGNLEKLAK
ncbi:RsfA family transcriptional regulator [Fictibacillus fluitans]|uniref:RsfA family transcriptional regulator n=1 Tax=Fictibacillus fluitans TaxID=3058422 RepID=A0ABT8HZT2_9BACL|nr:RsfA family transcriptional regulator [Fictibacillus sp. NE201]MDN4526273.1 RsfA family transcriptional regulator [Fictibacillus sp. NE201]